MHQDRWKRIEDILDTALTLSGDERTTYITNACGEDEDLLQEVYEFLEAIAESEQTRFLEGASADNAELIEKLPDHSAAFDQENIGTQIGAFKIVEKIGSGGMGSVYKAERVDGQFTQQVAIKLLQKGIQSEETMRRFRMEQEILASLKHPNIAQLYDGGLTSDGIPYLMMEFVDGVPVDTYCKDHQLNVDRRIELFKDVCSAVQFAHANLVIHRDLKAQNIYVTPEGVVKVLDFGIAKLLDPKLSKQTLLETRPGQKFWTPQYAAPEQVKGEAVTIATDVYALGVLLHKLLTNTYPLKLKDISLAEAERMIKEDSPVSMSQSVQKTVLKKTLTGDLDALVLKALRKEPEYRYSSVSQLIEELDRYKDGLPLTACKGTTSYRVGKFYRRHRTGIAVASFVFIIIAGLVGFYTWRIAQERNRAQAETAKAKEVTETMVGLFEANNPANARGDTVTVREVLERGTTKIQDDLQDQPEVKAALLTAIGRVYENLGLYEDATSLQEQALKLRRNTPGIARADIAENLDYLGVLHARQGALDTAEPLYREALSIKHALYEPTHPDIGKSLHNLATLTKNKGDYDLADSLYRQSLAIKRLHYESDHPSITKTLNNLAGLLTAKGDLEGAKPIFEEVLVIRRSLYGNEHPLTASSLNNLSVLHAMQGDFETAVPLIREALSIRRKVMGEEHPLVAQSMINLASMQRDLGDYESAEPTYRESLVLLRQYAGAEHPRTMIAQSGLANLLAEKKTYAVADSLLQQVVTIRRKDLGNKHPLLAQSLYERASVQHRSGNNRTAIELLREALEIQQSALPEGHRQTALTQSLLGACLISQNFYAEAEPLLHAGYASLNAKTGRKDRERKQTLERLVDLYNAWGKPSEAAAYRDTLNLAYNEDR